MTIDVFNLLAVFGFTIIIGYVGSLIFHKTQIPDVFWLLLFGLFLGPILGFADRALFLAISPFLSVVALTIILFDSGLNMDIYSAIHNAPRSFLLAVLNVIFSMVLVSLLLHYVFGVELILGLLVGAILGGTSSPIVISIVNRLKIRNNVKIILNLESIFTDAIVIVVSIAIINLMTHTAVNSPISAILANFSIGAVLGIIFGTVWLFVLDKIGGKPFDYMMTLAVLFLVYISVESHAGSGAIAALTFGLIIGNGSKFSKMLHMKVRKGADNLMKAFQGEITFFIRSFFFVFLGIIFVIETDFFPLLLYAVSITAMLLITRYIATKITSIKYNITKLEQSIIMIMVPRGLAAALIIQLAFSAGVPGIEIFSNVVFLVILITVLYTTVFVKKYSKNTDMPDNQDEKEKEVKLAQKELKMIDGEQKKKTKKGH